MIFTGFKFAAVPNWDVITPVKAPSNYKKPEAIAKYIAERMAVLAAGGAATDVLTGFVQQIFVLNTEPAGEKLLEGDAVCDFLAEAVQATEKGNGIVGYRIHRALKIIALMNAIHGDTLRNSVPVAHFKWIDEAYNKYRGFIDPVSLLFGTTDVDLNSVAMRCGVKINPEDPKSLAEFAQVMLRNVDIGP